MALDDELRGEKVRHIDWEELRSRSLRPEGFGSSRAQIWPEILGVTRMAKKEPESEFKVEDEHRDERQIRLDTDRSFVLYPVGAPDDDKETMQEKLNGLLISIFRRHPKLNYFQGYHDIVSVLFLTLPEEMQLVCAEKISLHRVRDSMGTTLEPILGLLRVTKNLLRLADLEYAQGLERSSQLPFYALSNLLTLFSHDMPTLPLIQHVFDYILCRPPIIVVYLSTAIILSRKDAIRQLDDEDEDEGMGMSHSLLSTLPPIIDDRESEEVGAEVDTEVKVDQIVLDEKLKAEALESEPMGVDGNMEVAELEPAPLTKSEDVKAELSETSEVSSDHSTEPIPPTPAKNSLPTSPSSPSRPSSPAPSRLHGHSEVTLTSLLTRADELYALYPPTHPDLLLSRIMGPQSVVHTWSESFSALPSDTEAEAMVACPGLVVYPYIDDDDVVEDPGDADDSEWEEKPAPGSRRKRFRGKLTGKVKNKLRRFRRVRMDQKTGMVAGAVLVLGIAMAVYGVRMRDRHPAAGFGHVGGILDYRHDWRKVTKWVGGAVAGVTERVVNGLSASTSHGG
ncbi:hypothetical protein DXG01_016231 [Tephrocybe rancida]|nr:hypothetical protein DXG01_016231 [Tephrocybe rancida]